MRLSVELRNEYALYINRLCGYLPIIFENGTFELLNIPKSDVDSVMDKLNKSSLVSGLCCKCDTQNCDTYMITGILLDVKDVVQEDIEVHKTLNPKIWDDKNELKPDVKEKIYDIVETFSKELAEDGVKLDIADIYVLGSNANYNYTDSSDLDVHIIANEQDDCADKHLPIIYNAYKRLFNNNYDITLNGINVEIYVEDKDNRSSTSSGIYSLKDGWIAKPTLYDIPKIDDAKFEALLQKWEDRYLTVSENPSLESITEFIDALYELRIDSVKESGEFGLGNLVFKEIRKLGYLDELKQLQLELTAKKLSL